MDEIYSLLYILLIISIAALPVIAVLSIANYAAAKKQRETMPVKHQQTNKNFKFIGQIVFSILLLLPIWLDFIPSNEWKDEGFRFSFWCSAATWILMLRLFYTGTITPKDPSILIIFIPFGSLLIWLLFYPIVTYSLPGIYTIAAGKRYESIEDVSKKHEVRRFGCDYLITNKFLERSFSDGLCISSKTYSNLGVNSQFRVTGKNSYFGVYVTHHNVVTQRLSPDK